MWILIILMFYFGGIEAKLIMQEFTSEETCFQAAKMIEILNNDLQTKIKIACVEK